MTANKIGRPKNNAAQRKAALKKRYAYKSKWQKEHPEKAREYQARWRAKQKGALDPETEIKAALKTMTDEQKRILLEQLKTMTAQSGQEGTDE